MNIRPKIPMFRNGGLPSTVTWTDPNSTWFTRSGDFGILEGTYNMLKPLYDKWKSSGTEEDYQAYKKAVDTLNTNQRYGYAPKHLQYQSGNNQLYKDNDVGAWQRYVRDNYGFINNSIGNNFSKYKIHSNNPYSGDNLGKEWKVDNLWAGITDDRTTWGNLLNPNDENYLKWKKKFSEIGIDYKTNPEWNTGDVLYGFLKDDTIDGGNPLGDKEVIVTPKKKKVEVPVGEKKDPESLWGKLGQGIKNIAPDLLDALRLAGNMYNNEQVYKESMKAIQPNLQHSYHTYRQVFGDEATKQGFYRRAVQGEQKAARPFTSDADRQVAYMNEAKRIGDELRAQGDLADNQRIRETSAESAAHLDANAERDTQVSNNNLTELIKANAAKHQLTAQKYSADWTNLEQYLMGQQYKLEKDKAEQKELEQQLALLNTQEELLTNPELRNLRDIAEEAYNNYSNYDGKDEDGENEPEDIVKEKKEQLKRTYEEAIKNLKLKQLQLSRNNLQEQYRIKAGKSGIKVEKKRKDESLKYLYKTSRDIVEHFRKMSKMTDDSRIKTLPKPIKLVSHPKKFQLGGVAPFTIYRPLGVGGETTTSSARTSGSSSGKSEKDTAAKDKLDMIKELFKQVQGLPIDVSKVYQEISGVLNKAKAFGEELSTDDLASMYLNVMNRMSQLKYSQESYKQAHAQAVANEALNEIAVGSRGELILQNMETGEIKRGTYSEWVNSDKKLNPLTNSQLLEMRAKSPNLVFDDDIFNVVNNGVGLTKIAKEIKSLAASLGSSEKKLEGISEVQSNKIKAGLSVLAGFDGTPDGFYKITQNSKDSSANVKAALNYIYEMLPTNYKTILKMHSGSEENSQKLIAQYLTSQTNDFYKEDIAPLTGKASDKNKENDIDKLGINSATQLLLGMSSPRPFAFSIGNGNMFNGLARVSSITKDGNSVGADYAFSEIYKSDLHKNLDLDNACFGDVPINKALKDRIIVDNSTIAGIDLPYTTDKNGRIIPDFQLLNRIEEADQEILRAGINPETEPQRVNEIYAKHNLPIKYGADNRLTGNYKRFAVIQATAIEDVFLNKSGLASNGTLSLVSDEDEINKYVNEIKKTTGQKDIDMDRPGIFTGNKDIYKGSIFIPIIGDLVDAVSATGGLKAGNYDELRSKYQTKNYNEAPQFVKQ